MEALARRGAPRTGRYRQRQGEILRAASRVLNRKGLKEMTLGEVAERVGLVPTGVAYYFRSKEALAEACFRRAIEVHRGLIVEAALEATPEARLGRLVRGYFEMLRRIALGEAEEVALFEDIRSLDDPQLEAAYEEMFRQARGLLGGRPASDADRTILNARTHFLIQQLIWVRYWLPAYPPEAYPRAAERMLEVLLHGLGRAPPAWPPAGLEVPPPASSLGAEGREQFLRAATLLINEQGFPGASVERIAARLKLTKGAFYHHVGAKDDLIEVCYLRTLEALRSVQRAADRLSGPAGDRLAACLAHLIGRQLDGETPLLRLLTASVPGPILQKTRPGREQVAIQFGATVSDGIADGSLRPVDARIAAEILTAAAIAGAELNNWLPESGGVDAMAAFVRPLFEGLTS